jgi:hypothetical protein
MKKFTVTYSFTRLSTGELVEQSRGVVVKMKTNPYFPTPAVQLTDLTTATDLVEGYYEISHNYGGKEATAKTKSARIALENLLRKQADYVKNIAYGSDVIILSSGFELSKVPAPAKHPEFEILLGEAPGQVILVHKAVKGATAYVWEFAKDAIPAEDNLWVFTGASSQRKCVIENLDSLSNYWFRVGPVLRNGTFNWSDPIKESTL